MSKLFSYDYDHHERYGETSLRCERSTDKMMDFDCCEEYLRSISNKILLW